jgi:hypothetical protein
VAYGKDTPTSAADPEVRAIHQYMTVFRTVLQPGAYWVDTIPWLRYLPWYGRKLNSEFEVSRKVYFGQMNRLKQQLVRMSDLPILAFYLNYPTAE